MSTTEIASNLLHQLIVLERQHSRDAPGTGDLVLELRTVLNALPTDAVFALVINSCELASEEGYWSCISTLRQRGDQETFDTCATWARDETPDKRRAAADILAELGHLSGAPRAERSWPLLQPLLHDSDVTVLASALSACGKLRVGEPVVLAAFATHEDVGIRFAAVGALSGRSDLLSNNGLILLSRDHDRDVRNWATFGLGQLTLCDTPEIRAALVERIGDDDPHLGSEIRGEALIGLARRGDANVLDALKRELAGPFHGAWCIEAAHALKDPSLLPLLAALRPRLNANDLNAFGDELDQAIAACSPKLG
jgi:HEAT repeat protein